MLNLITNIKTGLIKLLLLLIATLSMSYLNAQTNVNYAVHANIIYHFTKYIDWPESKKSGPFIIGVISDSGLFNDLTAATLNKTVGGQKIIVKRFNASESVSECHILFIGGEYWNAKKIIAGTKQASVLIITEEDGITYMSSCINFIVEDDKLKLEINKKNIESRSLKIASELLSLGRVIQ